MSSSGDHTLRQRNAFDQGEYVNYLEPTGSQQGTNETSIDMTRVLGGMYSGLEYRVFGQENVEVLAEYAGVPVRNGLTNELHITPVLADLMIMIEYGDEPLSRVSFAYRVMLASTWEFRFWWRRRRWGWMG